MGLILTSFLKQAGLQERGAKLCLFKWKDPGTAYPLEITIRPRPATRTGGKWQGDSVGGGSFEGYVDLGFTYSCPAAGRCFNNKKFAALFGAPIWVGSRVQISLPYYAGSHEKACAAKGVFSARERGVVLILNPSAEGLKINTKIPISCYNCQNFRECL